MTLRSSVGLVLVIVGFEACTSNDADPKAPSDNEGAESSPAYEADIRLS